MRLLITTQAVDLHDPVLGFFHRWIEEFAARFEEVHVICLREGVHELPKNVFVHSLGKEVSRSRFKYVWLFYRYIFAYRHDYDAVFVHMNPEYACLGGPFWRQWGKRVVVWYVHPKVVWQLRVAHWWAHSIASVSRATVGRAWRNIVATGHGVDTDVFTPGQAAPANSLLFLGRLDAIKRPDVFVRALEVLHEKGISFTADIVGDPTDPASLYAHDVRNRAATLALNNILTMKEAVSNTDAVALFRSHSVYVNLTPTGSFDKTLIEAAACGALVVAANQGLQDVLPAPLLVDPDKAESVAGGIESALKMLPDEREQLTKRLRTFAVASHSLQHLIPELTTLLSA